MVFVGCMFSARFYFSSPDFFRLVPGFASVLLPAAFSLLSFSVGQVRFGLFPVLLPLCFWPQFCLSFILCRISSFRVSFGLVSILLPFLLPAAIQFAFILRRAGSFRTFSVLLPSCVRPRFSLSFILRRAGLLPALLPTASDLRRFGPELAFIRFPPRRIGLPKWLTNFGR